MNQSDQTAKAERPWPLRLYVSGVLVLIIGLGSALWVYLSSISQVADDLTAFNAKQYDFQLERIGGRQALLIARFNDWLASLWHGRQLAYTLAILAIVLALLCFWLADCLAREDPSESDSEDGAPRS